MEPVGWNQSDARAAAKKITYPFEDKLICIMYKYCLFTLASLIF